MFSLRAPIQHRPASQPSSFPPFVGPSPARALAGCGNPRDRRLLHTVSAARAIDSMAAYRGRKVKGKALKLASSEQGIVLLLLSRLLEAGLGKNTLFLRAIRDGRDIPRPLGSSVVSRWLGGASSACYCSPSGTPRGIPISSPPGLPLWAQQSFCAWDRMTRTRRSLPLVAEALRPSRPCFALNASCIEVEGLRFRNQAVNLPDYSAQPAAISLCSIKVTTPSPDGDSGTPRPRRRCNRRCH